jgi:hypothetical protein
MFPVFMNLAVVAHGDRATYRDDYEFMVKLDIVASDDAPGKI